MSPTPTLGAELLRLEAALTRLRRLWESPALRREFQQRVGAVIEPALVRTLRAVANADHGCGVGDVATALDVDGSTASRLVDNAVASGLLARGSSPHDRRRSVLTLTDAGADLAQRSTRVRQELLTELTADLSDTDLDRLADLLERLGARLDELEQRS